MGRGEHVYLGSGAFSQAFVASAASLPHQDPCARALQSMQEDGSEHTENSAQGQNFQPLPGGFPGFYRGLFPAFSPSPCSPWLIPSGGGGG
jgi:hypothetical protein